MGFSRRNFFKRSAALGGAVAGAWAGAKADEVSKAIPESPKPAVTPEPHDIMDDINNLAQMPMSGYEINQRFSGVYAGSFAPFGVYASVFFQDPFVQKYPLYIPPEPRHLRLGDADVKSPKQT